MIVAKFLLLTLIFTIACVALLGGGPVVRSPTVGDRTLIAALFVAAGILASIVVLA